MEKYFGKDWSELFSDILQSDEFKKIPSQVYSNIPFGCKVYPEKENIFRAFKECPYEKLKVVILGQDCYHDGSADGLAFSNSQKFGRVSPSLQNIFTEIENDVYGGLKLDQDPNLTRWANQGILLLNTSLTVLSGKPESHCHIWQPITQKFIKRICEANSGLIFLLWGSHAKKYIEFIDKDKNYILTAVHPSPLSADKGFFGCRHFGKTNAILKEIGKTTGNYEQIEW